MDELDQVPWQQLPHAYGTGKASSGAPHTDVEGALRGLLDGDPEVLELAYEVLGSSIFHQGTIYEVTPHAVPFLAAFAAGVDVPRRSLWEVLTLLGEIAISSCHETESECQAGAFGPDVAPSTRAAFQGSKDYFAALVARDASFSSLVEWMLRVTATPSPTQDEVEQLRAALEATLEKGNEAAEQEGWD